MISYIILHYKNIDETVASLETLKKIISKDSHVIVVDNNTLNKDAEKRIRKYTNDIIKLETNLGFAKANNIGVEYAYKKYKDDFYVVMNNDVYIYQENFEATIRAIYNTKNFDILGPRIDSPSNESVNPFPVISGLNSIDFEIKRCKKLVNIYSSRILSFLLGLYLKVKYIFKKRIVPTNGEKKMEKVALHGCCIIFSKEYVLKYGNVFYNETFLFHEEEFLYHRILQDNLISLYDPSLKVFHKEGSSTMINNNYRKKKLFREQERLKSLNLLKKVVVNDEK